MATNFDIDLGNNQDNFDIDLNDQVESFVIDFGEITWVTNGDFNKLKNRPSYAGELMTGDTDIPLVPTATSQLTNDANFQNANDLSTAISNHNQSTSAHQDIRQAISDEATARFNADNSLQGQIDAITSASDVVDIVGTYAELQNYDTQHLKDNDVIKVLQDETHNDAMTYWRWSTHTDTWTYIGAEGPYYTKSETNTLLDEKLDVDEVPEGFFDGPATITPTDGTNIEISNGLKLKAINIKGDTKQQTYTGKNLAYTGWAADFVNRINDNARAVLVTQDNRSCVRWRADAGYGDYDNKYMFKINFEGNTQYTFSFEINPSTTSGDMSFTYTDGTSASAFEGITLTASTWQNVSVTSAPNKTLKYVNARYQSGGALIDLNTFMVEKGSTATAYEPYVGGVPAPNPDYPQAINVVTGTQTVTVTGKNLFDRTSAEENKLLAWATGLTANETGSIASDFIAVVPTEKLKFTYNSQVMFYDASKTYLGALQNDGVTIAIAGSSGGNFNKITVPNISSISYMRLGFRTAYNSGVNLLTANIQVEKGETATTYEPYQSQSYTVNLGSTELCKIGDYQDYIYKSGDDWYVHKEIGGTVFTGDEAGWNSTTLTTGIRYYLLSNDLGLPNRNGTTGEMVSNHFINIDYATYYNAGGVDGISFSYYNTNHYVQLFFQTAFASVNAFKTWLSTNNVTVYYTLATPTDTQITDSSLIGELNALLNATLYQPLTYMSSSGNLPAIIKVEAYTEHLNSLLEIAAEPTPTPITYSDFVGTDGVNAGSAGLVPAPATTDAGKFLKADGTWDTAGGGGGGVTVLTTADYNYPENNPEFLALWLLPVGQYVIDPYVKTIPEINGSTINQGFKQGLLVLNQKADGAFYTAFILSNFLDDKYYKVQGNGNLVTGFPHDI